MERFSKHKKEWFLNRVGKVLKIAHTFLTPQSERNKFMQTDFIKIESEQHAKAIHEYHLTKKINYYEPEN